MKILHNLRMPLSATTTLLGMLCLAVLLTMGSCRSKKEMVIPTDPAELAKADPVTRVNYNRLTATGIRGKVNLRVQRGQNHISVGGRIRMKRNEIVQVSIMPHGLVEVGILELTPDYLLLVDKWGKQYVKAKWSELKPLANANIDFYAFQALFWEELFIPGKKDRALKDDFVVSDLGQTMRLQPTRKAASQKDVELAFVAHSLNGLIQQTEVTTPKNSSLRFEWGYSEWMSLDGKDYPAQMTANISSDDVSVEASFKFSGMQVDTKMRDIRTTINPDRYRKVEIENILTRIMAM